MGLLRVPGIMDLLPTLTLLTVPMGHESGGETLTTGGGNYTSGSGHVTTGGEGTSPGGAEQTHRAQTAFHPVQHPPVPTPYPA